LKNAIWQPWLKQKQMEETITKKGMKTVFWKLCKGFFDPSYFTPHSAFDATSGEKFHFRWNKNSATYFFVFQKF
jgi:hypothetical protein